MQDSIFTKIIKGEIPAHKIYEDNKTLAFLDIRPETPGHVLVIPKVQVDKFYDLSDEDYQVLFLAVKKIAAHMEQALGARVMSKIIGTEVPHAHVHLFPADPTMTISELPQASDAELADMAKKLRMM